MKKLLVLIMALFMLCACNNDDSSKISSERYFDMLNLLNDVQNYATNPQHFNIDVELSLIDEGYRYYVIIDEPKIAMYNIQVMAIVEGDDYSETMAANIGIFEETPYNMIPNQVDVDKGYIEGLSISGLTSKESCTIDIIVRYEKEDSAEVIREYFRYDVSYAEADSAN